MSDNIFSDEDFDDYDDIKIQQQSGHRKNLLSADLPEKRRKRVKTNHGSLHL